MATTASESREGVFTATFMGSVSNVALPITSFIGVEVVELPLTTRRERSVVTVMRVIAVVDVSVEAVGAMKPGAGSNKHAAQKPVGSVVAVGGAVIWSVVKVPIRAHGRNANVDGNLGTATGGAAQQGNCKN